MAKLYFKYGAMGSSKTANALITRFNYQERDMKVWLIKPSIDDRDGANIIRSRIGLEATADVMTPDTDIFALFEESHRDADVIITDAKEGAIFQEAKDITIDHLTIETLDNSPAIRMGGVQNVTINGNNYAQIGQQQEINL